MAWIMLVAASAVEIVMGLRSNMQTAGPRPVPSIIGVGAALGSGPICSPSRCATCPAGTAYCRHGPASARWASPVLGMVLFGDPVSWLRLLHCHDHRRRRRFALPRGLIRRGFIQRLPARCRSPGGKCQLKAGASWRCWLGTRLEVAGFLRSGLPFFLLQGFAPRLSGCASCATGGCLSNLRFGLKSLCSRSDAAAADAFSRSPACPAAAWRCPGTGKGFDANALFQQPVRADSGKKAFCAVGRHLE